jgi:hypothetical protein
MTSPAGALKDSRSESNESHLQEIGFVSLENILPPRSQSHTEEIDEIDSIRNRHCRTLGFGGDSAAATAPKSETTGRGAFVMADSGPFAAAQSSRRQERFGSPRRRDFASIMPAMSISRGYSWT